MALPRQDVLVVEEYTDSGGEQRRTYTNVGRLIPSKDGTGYSLRLRPGVGLVGLGRDAPDAICREPRQRDGAGDGSGRGDGATGERSRPRATGAPDDVPF